MTKKQESAVEQQQNPIEKAIELFQAAKSNMMATFEPIYKNLFVRKEYSPLDFQLPQNIIVVGAGGTGGWFAPKAAKIISAALNKRMIEHKVNMIFVDQDTVETKNLIRQNYVTPDVGRNKAEVIATRYAHSITNENMSMSYIAAYLVDKSYPIPKGEEEKFVYIENVMSNCKRESYMVINLIDNMKSRKAIHKFCYLNKVDVIDVANNDYNGQLNYAAYSKGQGHVGSFFAVYPDAARDDDAIVLYNCADADANATEQLFNANDMAATMLGTFLANCIADRTVANHHVKFCTGVNMSISADHMFMVKNEGLAKTEAEVSVAADAAQQYDALIKSF